MSDILDQFYAQRRQNPAVNPPENRTSDLQSQKDELAAKLDAEFQEWAVNRDKYQVDLSQEEYDIINQAISNAEIPEEEAYRWATALEYNKQFGIGIADAYQNLEKYNAALWGENKSFVPKTNFKAIVDYGTLGRNTLRQGFIGNQVMAAEMSGDTEKLESLLKEWEALEAENESLADSQDRRWYIECLKFGAQSAPFTGYVVTAGLIGGLVSGGLGTGLAFAASMQNAMGLEYMDLRKEGASKENALFVSALSGSLQALVETASGNVAGILGKNALGAGVKKEVVEKITGNLFKRLHYDGTFAKLALNMAGEYVKENFEEGMEEVIQDLISKGTHALAAEFEGYDVDPITAEKVAKDAWENFRGGVMGSLVLGLAGTAAKTHGTIKEYKAVKDAAVEIPSEKLFEASVKDSPIFKDMTEEEKKETINQIWENNKGKREEELQASQEDLAEVYSAEDQEEMYDFEYDEEGNVINSTLKEPEPEQRTEAGSLYSEMPEFTENEDGTLSGTIIFGDETGENPKDYGHLNFIVDDENNKVTITEFKTKYSRDYLRNEMYADFANKFTGYDIVWDPKGKLGKTFKQTISGLNPRGKNFGLNYFDIHDETEHQQTRVKVAQELRANLNAAKVTDDMIAPLVAEFEALGNTFGLNVTDFYNQTFNGQIFGDVRVAQEAALSQGKAAIRGGITLDDKTGTLDGLRAVVYAAENADFSTFSHELAHLGRRMAELQNGALSEEINKAFGIDENGWTREKEELFAEGFEDYLHTGEAKNPALKDLFSKLAELLVRMYHALHDKITLSDDMKKVYDQLLSGDDSILRKAEEAVKAGVSSGETGNNVASQETNNKVKAPSAEELLAGVDDGELTDEEINNILDGLTPEEYLEKITKEQEADRVEEIRQQIEETKFDETTKDALADIISDPDIPVEKKASAVMNANGELYLEKQANIEYFRNLEGITEEERNQAIDDLMNDRDTNMNGTGFPNSLINKTPGTMIFQDTLFQIIGEKGAQALDEANEETIRMDNQRIAEEMEKAGKDARTIRMATGWERGKDKQWKYEISDIKIKPNPVYETDEGDYKLAKLNDVVEAEELFKAYPQLKDTVLQIQNLPLGVEGHYTKEDDLFPNGIITISSSNLRKENPEFTRLYEEFKNTDPGWKEYERKEAQYDNNEISASDFLEWEEKEWEKSEGYKYLNELLMGRIVPRMVDGLSGESTIVHEIQHAIQHFEGFATGGSPESLTAKVYNSLIDDLAPIYAEIGSDETLQSKIKAYNKANLELDFSRDDILDQIREVESIKDNDPKLIELWNKLQDISKKYNFVYKPEIEPLFDFRITDIDSSNAREALWRAKRLFNDRSQKDYHNLAGEVESRNAQLRAGMTMEERRRQLLEDTEDVARNDQIVTFDAVEMASIEAEYEEAEKEVKYDGNFVLTKDGKKDFGEITSEIGKAIGRQAGKIRLEIGEQGKNENKGYGEKHFQRAKRIKNLKDAGYNTARDFVEDVSKDYDAIYQGQGTTLVIVKIKNGLLAEYISLKPAEDNDFYTVETGLKLRSDYFKNKEPLWINPNGSMASMSGTAQSSQTNIPRANLGNIDTINVNGEISNVNNPSILFQDEKTLAGIHNLSEENLQHVFKMGGLANPSMAVIDTSSSDFNNFGEISLVAPKTLIDKTTGNNAGTFGADIYSPRYPSINVEVTDKGNTTIKEIIKDIEDDTFRQTVKERIKQAMEDNRPYNANRAFAVPFLLEKGDKSFYVIPEMDLDEDEFELYNKAVAADVYSPIDMTDEMKKDFTEMYLNKEIEKHKEKYPDWDQKDIDYLNESLRDEDTGYLNSRLFFNYWDHLRTTVRKAGQVDEYKTLDKAKELVESEKYRDEFDAYKKEKIASIDKKERIFNGYTPSGNRRWLDHTLENVSKFMKQQAIRGGETFSYGMGSTRARVAPKWTTLEQIAKNKDRLVSKDEFETVKAELESTYDELTDIISDGNGFDAGEARLNEALESVNPLSYLKREYDIDFSDDEKEMFTSFIEALKKMPTEYFETKFNRPVYMNEFYGAVIPRQTSQEVKDKLQEAGLTIKEYDDPDTRMQLIRQMGEAANGNILFQPDEEILNEAAQFKTWVEWMEYAHTFGLEGIPLDASSDWYLNTWEIAHNVSPTSAEKEAERLQKREDEYKVTGHDPITLDVLWIEMIQKPGGLESFIRRAYDLTHIDEQERAALDPEENAYINTIQNRVDNIFANGVWRSNMLRVHNGKELTPQHRKQLLTFIRNRTRDYRALYGTLFSDPKFAVPEAEELNYKEASRAIRNHLVNTFDEWKGLSPKKKNELLKYCDDMDIRNKFKQDRVKMNDEEVDAYIDLISKDLKKLAKESADMRSEFLNEIADLAGLQERDILRQFTDFENLAAEANERKIPLPAGSKDAIRTGEKYRRNVHNGIGRTYNDLAAAWATFKQEVEAKYKLQEKLRAENRIEELTEKIRADYDARRMKNTISKAEKIKAMQMEYADKKKQAQAVRELRDMRKKLVKAVMRRVDFNRIAYDQAREIIAIQKVFEPNLYGGVNRWIGTENKLAREIWSAWNTDIDAKEKMIERLSAKGHTDLIRKLEETLTEEDFETKWTQKDKKKLEKVMPKQDWIKELNLDVWKDERDNAIQLPIRQQTKTRMVTQADGTKREVIVTFAEMDPEIEQLIETSLGWDMAQRIQFKFFEDWTTGEMEELARRINELYKEGRDKLAARKEAERRMADRIRSQIRDAINNTGIQINEDDPDDVKKKKQEKINKILGISHELPGTAASKNEKQQTFIDRLLHSYHDANMRRVARILDNYHEAVMTDLLYWQENECFNKQQRSIDRRNAKIDAAIKSGNLDMKELGKVYNFNSQFNFTYDELLMLHAAQMNQNEYFAEQKKDNPALEERDALEESAYQAIVYGNMITPEERDEARKTDEAILEAEKARLDALHAAELSGNEEEIARLQARASDSVDDAGNLLLMGTVNLKAKAKGRFNAILKDTEAIRDKFMPLIEAIRKDYADEFDRINRTSIDEFNAPVWREKWYLPLVRLTAAGDTHENRLKQDLLMHSVGTGKAGTEKGFTKKRIEIGALHQTPVELGLYTTWADSVERNEHFIAYAAYVRELNRVLFSKDALGMMQEIENRYGKGMKDYLESYVKEVANPNTVEPKKGLDRVMHMMRGNTAPAYLGWKFSSVLKQGIESPAPFMQFINPLEYMHGAMQLATKKWTRESIAAKSAFMQSRVFDPIADLINENVEKSFSKKSYYLKKFQQKGMEGLEWIDWACVAPGWIAIYEKEYARLQAAEQDMFEKRVAQLKEQNETRYGSTRLSEEEINRMAMDDVMSDIEIQAVNKADDCVRLCQPSARKVDLAPMFKNNSEAAKAVLQFQTALNVIWQNIRYDIPYAVKNQQYSNIVGMVLGYVMAGVISGVVTKGIAGGDDDEPDAKEVAKRLAFYSTTQFVDSVPIMGGTLDGLAEKMITGKGTTLNNSSIFPTFQKYVDAASKLASKDYLKAVRSMEQGLQLTLGLPYSGIRELEAMFGILDGEEGLEFNPEALAGRR